jgi:hypothetical protein
MARLVFMDLGSIGIRISNGFLGYRKKKKLTDIGFWLIYRIWISYLVGLRTLDGFPDIGLIDAISINF